jgi:hypothetical protein
MAELEKAGVPTVGIVDRTFEKNWQASSRVFGVKVLRKLLVPRPLVGLKPEDVHPFVDAVFEELVSALTAPMEAESSDVTADSTDIIVIQGEDRYAALEKMNRQFLELGWGDGFPLWAPTRERVDAMLKGTSRSPSHVVATLSPGMGLATVEKIAINAVMAGCKPEHLPVLLAAVDAIADPRYMLRNVAMSTGAHAPFMFLNGPVVNDLGVATGRCALGPGAQSAVNTVLGRAMRLIFMNVGHAYPGVMDMDTLGTAFKYSLCLGEAEEASAWEPLHVERGFQSGQSVVTMFSTYGIMEVEDNNGTTPEEILDTACSNACARGIKSVGFWLLGWRADAQAGVDVKETHQFVVCPVHAAIFRKAGWSKAQVKQYLYANARLPFGELMKNTEPAAFRDAHPRLQWLWDSPETRLPVLETPECFDIVVAGGMGGRSAWSYGAAEPVSRCIDDWK